jgi:GNAT superfamily N-acetyltransferase
LTDVTLDVMRHEDIDAGLELCRAAGWNQTRRDWERFLAATPDGARAARLDGRVVGTSATIRYGDAFAWIGMVLVDPRHRGHGVGTRLFDAALALLADVPAAKLDATPAGRPLYLKQGFAEEYRIHRMQRSPADGDAAHSPGVRPLTAVDLSSVAEFDGRAFGVSRYGMLEWLLEGAPELACVATGSAGIDGFAMGRRGHLFDHIGPVVARDAATAQALAGYAISRATRSVVVDATPHVPSWRAWLEAMGFVEQRELIRMTRGAPPAVPLERQFAILGPEFG